MPSLFPDGEFPDGVTVRWAVVADALPWCEFLAAEQVRTYEQLTPPQFAQLRQAEIAAAAASLAAEIESGQSRHLVAEGDGRIVAVASAGPGPQQWEIGLGLTPAPAPQSLHRLYLHPCTHGTGLADALMAGVLLPGPAYLWLIDGNDRAEQFYRRRGFRALDEQVTTGPSWGEIPMHRMVRD